VKIGFGFPVDPLWSFPFACVTVDGSSCPPVILWMGTESHLLDAYLSFREMMRQRGAGGRGPPKLPRGTLGLGGLVIAGGIAIFAINASIFNGTLLSMSNRI
jgi:hypothetical protein